MPAPSISCPAAARVASILVGIGAVRITTAQPFVYTSGWASPVYVDTRLLMSDVSLRTEIMDLAATAMAPVVEGRGINAVVGAESSGIAFAAWLAERLALPLLYLRKRPMGWGQAARLEGRLPPAACLLYVDDVTTDGRSKLAAAKALRQGDAAVDDVLVILDYAIYPRTAGLSDAAAPRIHALTHWPDLLAALRAEGGLSAEAERTLAAFDADPVRWSLENGGVGA